MPPRPHPKTSIVNEADRQSRAAFECALHYVDIGKAKPILGPAMVGCAMGYASLGIAIASIGIFAGIVEAAQASPPELRNTSAH